MTTHSKHIKSILIISGFWPTRENPISGVFVVEQIAALVSLGHSVVLILTSTLGRRDTFVPLGELGLDPTRVHTYEIAAIRFPEKLSATLITYRLNILLSGWAIRRALVKILQVHSIHGTIVHGIRYSGLSVKIWNSTIRRRVLCIVHGVEPFYSSVPIKKITRELTYRLAKTDLTLVLVGRFLKAYAEDLGFGPHRLVVVPNGSTIPPLNSVRPIGLTRRSWSICSVSNLTKVKGIDDTISALALLTSIGLKDWRYTVIGDGPERTRLMELAHEHGFSEFIEFKGRLTREDTLREMSKCDVFCLPSWGEAFGIVYLEAMARMRPVIGCNNCGPADFVTHNYDGLLVPPHSPASIAQELTKLWTAPEEMRKIGVNGRYTAEQYSWTRNAVEMISLFETSYTTNDIQS